MVALERLSTAAGWVRYSRTCPVSGSASASGSGSVGGRADGDQAASERAAVAVAIGCAGASGRSGRNQAGGPGGGGQRCGGEGPLPLRRGRARGLSYTGAAPSPS